MKSLSSCARTIAPVWNSSLYLSAVQIIQYSPYQITLCRHHQSAPDTWHLLTPEWHQWFLQPANHLYRNPKEWFVVPSHQQWREYDHQHHRKEAIKLNPKKEIDMSYMERELNAPSSKWELHQRQAWRLASRDCMNMKSSPLDLKGIYT